MVFNIKNSSRQLYLSPPQKKPAAIQPPTRTKKLRVYLIHYFTLFLGVLHLTGSLMMPRPRMALLDVSYTA